MFPNAGRAASPSVLLSHFGLALLVLAALALCPAAARAQSGTDFSGTGGRHSIRGRLVFPSGQRADLRLKVRLESPGFGDLSVFSDQNGTFGFQSLKPGSYTVVIEGGEFYETVRETVFIESANIRSRRGGSDMAVPIARPYTVQVYLRPKKQGGFEARPGIINAALSGIPKPALESYNKGVEAARRGDAGKAVEQFQAAVAIHPNFALALSELGMQYFKLRQPDKAAESLRAALKLSPDDYVTLVSLGVALLEKREYGEAEEPLRLALKKNNTLPFAHHYLGVVLLRRRNLEEAEKELQRSIELGSGGEQLTQAHYYLGGIYWAKKEYKRAIGELEAYLKLSPNLPEADRERVRATIKELRGKI